MTKGKTANEIRLTQSTTTYFPYFPLRCQNPKTNPLTFSVHAAITVSSNLANSREIDTRTVERVYWKQLLHMKKYILDIKKHSIAAVSNLLLFKQILNQQLISN